MDSTMNMTMNMTDSIMDIAMDVMTTGMDMATDMTDSTMDMGMDTTMDMNTGMDMTNMSSGSEAVMDHTAMLSGNPFCTSHASHSVGSTQGDGMIMYMDGFRVSLRGNQPCLNLFFPGWTLDTPGKFAAAMIGIALLGVFVEGVSKLRHRTVKAAKRAHVSEDLQRWNPQFLRFAITLLHGSQALTGYILMLATMTFSIELLLSAVFGLALGYAIFFQTEEHYLGGLDSGHVTTNPCCGFMEEEAKELRREDTNGNATESSSDRTSHEDNETHQQEENTVASANNV